MGRAAAKCSLLMCSTPFGITDSYTRFLNDMVSGIHVCSTPFGITDSYTDHRALGQVLVAAVVLNAFRHH